MTIILLLALLPFLLGLASARRLQADAGGTISGVAQPGDYGGNFLPSGGTHTPGKTGTSVGTGSSSGRGDPILQDFKGRTFEFFGEVGSTYQLLSDAHHALNVHLKFAQMFDHNGTYMDGFSLHYRGHKVLVTLTDNDQLSVAVDGKVLALAAGQTEAEQLLGLTEGELHVLLQEHRQGLGYAVELVTDVIGLVIWVTPAGLYDEGGVLQPNYLNFDLRLMGRPAEDTMEGVLGHTYNEVLSATSQDEDDFEFHHPASLYEVASLEESELVNKPATAAASVSRQRMLLSEGQDMKPEQGPKFPMHAGGSSNPRQGRSSLATVPKTVPHSDS